MGIPYLYIAIAIILISGTLGGVIYILSNKTMKPIPVPTPSPTPSPTKKPIATCPSNCNSRGPCIDGKCACPKPWYGNDCSIKCDDTINGKCNSDGKLICNPGWYPEGSCTKKCDLTNCKSPGGTCQTDGSCKCSDNFTGPECSTCKDGFFGANCNLSATATCNNRGRPDKPDGTCTCNTDSNGPFCQYTRSGTCNNLGSPKMDGTCACDSGAVGNNCEYNRTTLCNGNGKAKTEYNQMTDTYDYRCDCDSTDYIMTLSTPSTEYCKYKKSDCGLYGGKWIEGLGCSCPDNSVKNSYPFCANACNVKCFDAYKAIDPNDPTKIALGSAVLAGCLISCTGKIS